MNKTVQILLVEDDIVDVKAFKRALTNLKIANPLNVASDGVEALELLRGTEGRQALTRPYLIVLDINMPRMNGLEFLQELRGDTQLHDTLVFMMTTSAADRDRIEAYRLNVAGYIVKASLEESFMDAVRMLQHYWRVVEFP